MTNYLFSLLFILVLTSVYFLIAVYKKDNSIIDRFYGITFVIVAWGMASLKQNISPLSPVNMLILILITIWGVRLSSRIHLKNRKKGEDFRYAKWREEWTKQGMGYFYKRSCVQIFLLQGLVVSVVLLPFTLTLMDPISTPSFLVPLGALVWLVGFFFESVGDAQLDRFVRRHKTEGNKIMKTGLWKYTRHPNYFGESSMWVGLSLIALPYSSLLVLLSPVIITYLLIKVSGIPMMEKRWSGDHEWEEYKKKTSAFIPLPPKA